MPWMHASSTSIIGGFVDEAEYTRPHRWTTNRRYPFTGLAAPELG